MRLLGRLILLTIGLAIAVPFGFLALLVGVTLDPAARDLLGALGLAGVEAIVSDLAQVKPPFVRLASSSTLELAATNDPEDELSGTPSVSLHLRIEQD